MKRIEINHTTRYDFGTPARLGLHTLLLRPREGHDLRIARSELDIAPLAFLTWRRDLYDNVLGLAAFGEAPTSELSIESRLEVELYDTTPLDFLVDDHALHIPFNYKPEEHIALAPYLSSDYANDARLLRWVEQFRRVPRGTETYTVVDRMNHQIHADFGYEVREEEGVRTPAETLGLKKGSCRDLAALFLESCRHIGIAARFVSGYVHGPATEAGGASTHAWAEVYLPGAGWKGFDPTNDVIVGSDHIPVAVHRHPEAIPPVAGTFTGPKNLSAAMFVDVQISAIPDP